LKEVFKVFVGKENEEKTILLIRKLKVTKFKHNFWHDGIKNKYIGVTKIKVNNKK
jgi:hypothetical protein